MALRKVGSFRGPLSDSEERFVYTDGFSTFINENGVLYSNEDMAEYALYLNSPWSALQEKYVIARNVVSVDHPVDEKAEWLCTYSVIGFESLTACVIGHGFTEEAALADCERIFGLLQRHYNPEDRTV